MSLLSTAKKITERFDRMYIVATPADAGDIVALAISAAGDPLPHFTASEPERAAAAYDLAACIRSASSILTTAERVAFACFLLDGDA
jgi:hypothetical protein